MAAPHLGAASYLGMIDKSAGYVYTKATAAYTHWMLELTMAIGHILLNQFHMIKIAYKSQLACNYFYVLIVHLVISATYLNN